MFPPGVAGSLLPVAATTRSIYSPPVRDQGELGSCTANAGCAAAGYLYHRLTGRPDPMFSRLDLYATTRELEGTPLTEDSGCEVRDVFKAMARWGVCFERTWPYRVEKFDRHPSRAATIEAMRHQALRYLRCGSLADIKHSIAGGHPVIGGFQCYDSLESEEVGATGDVPVPGPDEAAIGGHCVLFVGYDDDAHMVEFQNSWGLSWGRSGYGRLPYEFFERALADDFWTIRGLE